MSDTSIEDAKLQEILSSIMLTVFGASVTNNVPLANQFNDADWNQTLSRAVNEELGVSLSPEEVVSSGSLLQLSKAVGNQLTRNPHSQSVVDIYAKLERLAKDELHPNIVYHWNARWSDFNAAGNWLTRPDGLDYVELTMRMEEEFGFSISNRDAEAMETVGQTVRYLWRRSCEQSFTLRQRPENLCRSVFIFHEIRRLLIIRGGVQRAAVRLEARLGDLLPNWYLQFWKQVQDIFRVNLPQGSLLTFSLGLEKRTTVKELVALIVSSKS